MTPGSDGLRSVICYRGTSMWPTLRDGDLLEVDAWRPSGLRAGDVVVVSPPDRDEVLIHRIVGVTTAGIRTAGDNNPAADPWLLPYEAVQARVTGARRGGGRIRVVSGRRGTLRRRTAGLRRRLRATSSQSLGPAYRYLGAHLGGLWPGGLAPGLKVLVFRAHEDELPMLLAGRTVVGRFDTGRGRWVIRPPYRLLVDERRLPHPDGATTDPR